MSSLNWSEEDFELEEVDELEIRDSNLDVLDGVADPIVDVREEAELNELRTEALESQANADAAIAVGDYEAAAYHKELAEEATAASGSGAILEGPSSMELQVADERQDRAMDLEAQQAEMAKAGDYESARELASNAAYELKASDQMAGGADHSGQATLEVGNMEWADWHQQISNESLASAADFANHGNLEAAQNHLQDAIDHGVVADHYGDLGEHGGAMAATDPSPPIESHHYDTYSPSIPTASIASSSVSASTTDSGGTDANAD